MSRRGDVVEIVWPYSDLTGSKRRPAVMIQADFLNELLDDTILVQITSTDHGLGTEVRLDPAVETDSGLSKRCVASCTNVLTFDQSFIVRTVGFLSRGALEQIEASLKTALGIQ
jgi:mRNA interferase MazF